VEIVTSRTLLVSADPAALLVFYRDVLNLPIAREYPGGTVFHAGNGTLEVPAHLRAEHATPPPDVLWLQVRDLDAAHAELAEAGVPVDAPPEVKPWGLIEMTVRDPDGRTLILVQIPADHPLRRDTRWD